MYDELAPNVLEESLIRDAVCRQDPDALDQTLRSMVVHRPDRILEIIRYLPFPTGLGDDFITIRNVGFRWNQVTKRLERV